MLHFLAFSNVPWVCFIYVDTIRTRHLHRYLNKPSHSSKHLKIEGCNIRYLVTFNFFMAYGRNNVEHVIFLVVSLIDCCFHFVYMEAPFFRANKVNLLVVNV
jgi:hypothetical protein